MKFGLHGINMDGCKDPVAAAGVTRAAEDAGFESVWGGEHIVLPRPRPERSILEPEEPMVDPIVMLSFLAGQTSRIRLGTGIILVPQHNPVVLAKRLASLDVVSGGRLIFGVGVGYLEAEFNALGVPYPNRGPRTDDYLSAIETLWQAKPPVYNGPYVQFDGIDAYPRPVQQPRPPMVIGGNSPAAFRRAVTRAEGWYGFGLTFDRLEAALDGLREASERYERPAHLPPLEISACMFVRIDEAAAEQAANLGVDRLILTRRTLDGPGLEAFVTDAGKNLVPRFA